MSDHNSAQDESTLEPNALKHLSKKQVDRLLMEVGKMPGAGLEFSLGVFTAMAAVVGNEDLRSEILQGLVYLQYTRTVTEQQNTATLTEALKKRLNVSEEEFESVVHAAESMIMQLQQSEQGE